MSYPKIYEVLPKDIILQIQDYIEELGLDIDKFWFLLLFVYDFCESVCIDGIGLADSAYDQLQKLIDFMVRL